MTDQEMRIALAEWMGWKDIDQYFGLKDLYGVCPHPNESFKVLVLPQLTLDWLHECASVFEMLHATAHQRAESLLKTVGKWKE